MSLLYSIREGMAGFRRARFAVLASTGAIVIALTLIGAIGLIAYHTERITTYMRQQSGEVEIFLLDAGEEAATEIQARLDSLDSITESQYISQEEAEAIFREEFGEEGDVFLGESFLPASFKVRFAPAYATVDSLAPRVALFETWPLVDEVVFNQPLLIRVQRNLQLVTTVAFALGLIVGLASLFLIANTIRLTIYARRLLIRTMKLVGATNAFIRRPFLVEGLAQGLIAGLIASAVVWGLHAMLMRYIPLLDLESWPGGSPLFFFAGMLLMGMVLGWFGSLFATHRFIRHVAVS